jgi:hypothetical protein
MCESHVKTVAVTTIKLCPVNVRVEVFMVVTMKMPSSGMLRHVALVRTKVLEGHSASIIRAARIGELVTMLAVTSNRRTLRRHYIPLKCRFLQEPHGVMSQNTAFLISCECLGMNVLMILGICYVVCECYCYWINS